MKRTVTESGRAPKNGRSPARPSPGAPSLEAALSSCGDGAVVVGDDGRITLWNASAERILGYGAAEAVGRAPCEVFSSDDGYGRLCYGGCHVETLIESGRLFQAFDLRTRTKRGEAVWINLSILVVPRNGSSRPQGVHIFRDVTETKALLSLAGERFLSPDPKAAMAARAGLTRRQLELLRLMTLGLNTAAAAERLRVSPATIRNHVQNIFGKLGVHSRLEAVAYAHRHRLD